MRPRYRQAKDVPPHQRQRVMKVLVGPLVLRAVLPAFGIWWLFILAGLATTRAVRPQVDTNGWPFILWFFPLSCAIFALAMTTSQVLLIRWWIRYRTARRGRAVAMRDVLRTSDLQPSGWRRLLLKLYGVTPDDLSLLPSLWRPASRITRSCTGPTTRVQHEGRCAPAAERQDVMQQKSLRVVLREGGVWRVLGLYYPTLIVGYPVIVLLLGHRLTDGWTLLREQPVLPTTLVIMPLLIIAMDVFKFFLERWLGDSGDRPAE